MKIRINKMTIIYIALFCITISWSKFFIVRGLQDCLEYIGLFGILLGIYIRSYRKEDIKRILLLVTIMFFFTIGLILQDLAISKKMNAIVSMFILSSIAVMPCAKIQRFDDILGIEKSIAFGLSVSTILGIISGIGVTTGASEGIIFSWGFNAGLEHRNYCSYVFWGMFIIEYIRLKVGRAKNTNKLIIIALLILSTNSRSAILLLLLFLVVSNINRIRLSRYKKRMGLALFCFIGIVIGVPAFQVMKNNSETFFFRLNGLFNYLKMFSRDIKCMQIGNLKITCLNPYMSYDENIRSVIGWNGSTELVLLNVLIKNGIIGLLGYFLIFAYYFKMTKKLHDEKLKNITLAIIICFIISAFVESYVANINHIFTVFVYLLLSNISKFDNSPKKESELV